MTESVDSKQRANMTTFINPFACKQNAIQNLNLISKYPEEGRQIWNPSIKGSDTQICLHQVAIKGGLKVSASFRDE